MLVRHLHILSWLSFYMSYYSLRIHIKHLDFLKEKKKPIKRTVTQKKQTNKNKGLSTFPLTASLAQAISDDLHFMVRIFPSPSCKTVALFLNQPLSVKINCKGHKSIESRLHIVKIQLISLCPVNITR